MNKSELVEKIAEGSDLSKADAGRALDATIGAIKTALGKKDKITLVGFGSFESVHRSARKGRNPRDGKEITIKAKNVVKFQPGSELKKAVN